MKLQPLSDRVVVKPQEAEEKTASGIILPDTAKENPQVGKVVAVGKGYPAREFVKRAVPDLPLLLS